MYEKLKQLLVDSKEMVPKPFIGYGNPDAKILIIGKECTNQEPQSVTYAINNNYEQWENIVTKNLGIASIEKWVEQPNEDWNRFNPLFPYFGQYYRMESVDKRGNVRGQWGTSATCYAYQKLMDYIFPLPQERQCNDRLDFYTKCFTTELSTNCLKSSGKWNQNTENSIFLRIKQASGILRQPFFQSFPIIILACHHYKDVYNIDFEECFNQKFIKCTELGNHEFINIHRNEHQLLLHTNHLSMRSNLYLEQIAKLCKDYLTNKTE